MSSLFNPIRVLCKKAPDVPEGNANPIEINAEPKIKYGKEFPKTKNKLDYFIKLVMILSLIEPIKNLRFKERLLLAYLLFYNDKYKEY